MIPALCVESGIPECEFATVLVLLNMGFWSVREAALADRYNNQLTEVEMNITSLSGLRMVV